MTLYDWPRAAAYGRVIPKNKIYEHADASAALKELFVSKVERIIWSYKLAPETVNLTGTKRVAEIQVLRVALRSPALNQDVLRAIDRAIPFPLIFELAHGRRIRTVAAHKRPNEVDGTSWVVSGYFEGDWRLEDAPRAPFPVALNMGALYERILGPLVEGRIASLISGMSEAPQALSTPAALEEPVSLEARVERAETLKTKAREVKRVEARLMRERQFNKRVAINAELRAIRRELERLAAGDPAATMMND